MTRSDPRRSKFAMMHNTALNAAVVGFGLWSDTLGAKCDGEISSRFSAARRRLGAAFAWPLVAWSAPHLPKLPNEDP
jgi:hypothetical protein